MLLHSGESRLRSAFAVLEGDSPEHAQGPGVLYLTTQRLVFETAHPRGAVRGLVARRGTRTAMDASLTQVRNVEVRRPRIGRERLVVELTIGRPAFDVLDPDAWAAAIALAKRTAPAPGGPVSTHVIERQVVKIRCRYCGSLGNEVDGRCPTCGAPL
jgi:Zn finger protein HypA/HybF involved in hydrogenase expression